MGWVEYEKLDKYRQNMKNKLEKMLKKHNRVAMQEPTAIGKSYMMIEMCKEKDGNKIIFEPTRVLADKFEDSIKGTNTEVMIYQNLLHLSDIDLKNIFKNIDYLFLDEVHRIGAEKWGIQMEKIFKMFPNMKIIGLTATPIRTDRINVFTKFFDDIQTEPMDLLTAIEEHLLPQITYVTAYASISKEIKSRKEAIRESKALFPGMKNKYLKVLETHKHKLESIMNIPSILKKYIRSDKINDKNFKILLFVPRLNQIDEAEEESLKWFNEAFPEKKINIYKLKNVGRRKNKEEVENFENNININEIDIMISVNKLIEGFHIERVSSAIFLRRTYSNIVFLQQIGRTLSESEPIVFDFVENHKSVKDGLEMDFEKFKNYSLKNKDNRMDEPIIWLNDELLEVEKVFDKIEPSNRYKPVSEYEIKYLQENAKNKTIFQLAKNLHTDFYRVERILKELNLEARKEPRFYLDKAIEMARNGSCIEEILEETGLKRKQFSDALRNNYDSNVKQEIKDLLNLQSKTVGNHRKEIIKLGKQGKTLYEIAEITGFTYKQILDYVTHNKIEYKKIKNNSGCFKPNLEKQQKVADFVKNHPEMNVNQVRIHFNSSSKFINDILEKEEIKLPDGRKLRQIPEEIKDYLIQEAENKTIRELSNELGIKYDKIYDFYHRNNIKFKLCTTNLSRRRKFSTEEKSYVINNFEIKTKKEMRKHLKCSLRTLNNLIKEIGLINNLE